MEKYTLHQDMPLMCVTAHSFPEGIGEAFNQLQSMLPTSKDREFFGISYPTEGGLMYKAAVLQAKVKSMVVKASSSGKENT